MSAPRGESIRHLMMAVLDGEAGDAEQETLNQHLAENPALAREFAQLQRLKEVTTMMTPRPPANHVWDNYWGSVYRRLERGIAWILLSVGSTVLIGYGLWRILDDTNVPEIVRWGLLATLLGLAILLISVIREKVTRNRTDSYEDVIQ